jgi:hypothetical protein
MAGYELESLRSLISGYSIDRKKNAGETTEPLLKHFGGGNFGRIHRKFSRVTNGRRYLWVDRALVLKCHLAHFGQTTKDCSATALGRNR